MKGEGIIKRIKLLLVDDHEVVMLGLKTLFQSKSNVEVIGAIKSGYEAIEFCRGNTPDIVLLDIRMPGLSGIETCREIKQISPNIKVIMLTSYADEEAIFASLLAGAEGYVLKQIGSKNLIEAIEAVRDGKALLDPIVTKRLIEKVKNMSNGENSSYSSQGNDYEKLETLTRQEKRVLSLMCTGKTNRKIAEEMFLSEKTIRNYVSSILQKLNFQSRAEAIAFGIENRINKK